MVIFSDGIPYKAKADSKAAVLQANAHNVVLYPVVLGDRIRGGPSDFLREISQKRFADVGPATGGRSLAPLTLTSNALEDILLIIAADLLSEYIAGYHSNAPQRKGKHRVQVELRDKSRGQLRGGEKNFHDAAR
jgi:hypothetical protein